jgi:DNA-binding transcriptional LysR family regulator
VHATIFHNTALAEYEAGRYRAAAAITMAVPMAVRPQIEALKNGQLDIGFVRPPVTDAALAGEVLLREPFVAALPARHRLARKKSVALSVLAGEPFVLPPQQTVPVYHDLILSMPRGWIYPQRSSRSGSCPTDAWHGCSRRGRCAGACSVGPRHRRSDEPHSFAR